MLEFGGWMERQPWLLVKINRVIQSGSGYLNLFGRFGRVRRWWWIWCGDIEGWRWMDGWVMVSYV